MATIVFDEEINPITGSVSGVTFSNSQAGASVRRRPSPVQHHTTPRMAIWEILSRVGKHFWSLTNPQKLNWFRWAQRNGIARPFPIGLYQQANAAYLACLVPCLLADDPLYNNPPPNLPYMGVNFTSLTRIDKNTVRAVFNPTPAGGFRHIYLRQTLPTPGRKNLSVDDSYIAEYAPHNATSPHDFSTHFQHIAGWNCRYFTGSQDHLGRRSSLDQWDL